MNSRAETGCGGDRPETALEATRRAPRSSRPSGSRGGCRCCRTSAGRSGPRHPRCRRRRTRSSGRSGARGRRVTASGMLPAWMARVLKPYSRSAMGSGYPCTLSCCAVLRSSAASRRRSRIANVAHSAKVTTAKIANTITHTPTSPTSVPLIAVGSTSSANANAMTRNAAEPERLGLLVQLAPLEEAERKDRDDRRGEALGGERHERVAEQRAAEFGGRSARDQGGVPEPGAHGDADDERELQQRDPGGDPLTRLQQLESDHDADEEAGGELEDACRDDADHREDRDRGPQVHLRVHAPGRRGSAVR